MRPLLLDNDLDALLVSDPVNRRYLSGFTGSSGWLIVSARRAILATDFRYVEQATREAPDFELLRTTRNLRDWLSALLSELGSRRLGFNPNSVTCAAHDALVGAIQNTHPETKLLPAAGLVEQLRSLKEPQELARITNAAHMVDAAFEHVADLIQPGMTECEAAWELERCLRELGSETIPFEIIVASGPNSALPHARPTQRVIQPGEPVLIDMGARVEGYCSDFSRTVCCGTPDKTFRKLYGIVFQAQVAAIRGVRADSQASDVDRIARDIIDKAGYGDAFGHSLGHGLGLAPHESPTIGPSSADSLIDGMVFTVEPGIYLPGWGGVRIEDTVVLQQGEAEVLTTSRKDAASASLPNAGPSQGRRDPHI